MSARRLLVILFLFFTFFPFNQAQAAPAEASHSAILTTDSLLINMVHTYSCMVGGHAIDAKPCFESLGGESVKSLTGVDSSTGALGMTSTLVYTLYQTPPLTSSEYLADLGERFNPVKTAHAQVRGSGSRVTAPVLGIWKMMRNLAYLAMTLVFIITGFMIMLQRKINPQTVISIQNALPGLVVGLIMITFSYFFAALIVDTSYLSINLIGNILEKTHYDTQLSNSTQTLLKPGTTRDIMKNESVVSLYASFIGHTGDARIPLQNTVESSFNFLKQGTFLEELINGILFTIGCSYGYAAGFSVIPANIDILGNGVGTLSSVIGGYAGCLAAGGGLAWQKFYIAGVILYLVLTFMLLVAMFRVVFSLIGCYIQIVILTAVAPLYFLMSALPGRGGTSGQWFKSMLGNVMVFPAIYVVFIFAAFMGSTTAGSNGPAGGAGIISDKFPGIAAFDYTSTFLRDSSLPLFGGLPSDLVRMLVAYGLLLGMAGIPDMVKGAFGAKGGLPGIGQSATANIGLGMMLGSQSASIGVNRFWRGAVDRDGRPIRGREGIIQQAIHGGRNQLAGLHPRLRGLEYRHPIE